MTEDFWAEDEAREDAARDADMEMAAMNAAGDAVAAWRRAGNCAHMSAAGYHSAFPERGLKRGQVRCMDGCGRVFSSDEDWYAAMDAAVNGEEW